jgi:hypothetical protein
MQFLGRYVATASLVARAALASACNQPAQQDTRAAEEAAIRAASAEWAKVAAAKDLEKTLS